MKFKFNRRKLTFRRFSYYLFIATIVISCITNGIFAKFTTESDGGDGARVADFGVVVNISGDLFSTAYNKYIEGNVTSNNPTTFDANEDTVSVRAKSKTKTDGKLNNVVAPGTKNDVGINVSVTGTPETDCQLGYSLYFKTIYLSGGSASNGTSYGLMVPFEKGIVNESNFKELVEAGIYTSDNGKDYQTYTKVSEGASFNKDANYCKLKDAVIVSPGESYMPIKYYVNIKTETETETGTETKITPNLLNTSYKCDAEYFVDILLSNFMLYTFKEGEPDGYIYEGYAFDDVTFESNAEINKNFSITWEWPYHQIENPTTEEAKKELAWCNACDTILGYIAAGKNVVKTEVYNNGTTGNYTNNLIKGEAFFNPDYNLDIAFDYSITIDQVD